MDDFEGNYRKGLVRKLSQSKKEDRLDILRREKGSSTYPHSKARHDLESFDFQQEKKLEKIVKLSKTIEELKENINKSSLFIRNPIMLGIDHSEHLFKRITLADSFSYPWLLPESGGLREKFYFLLKNEEKEIKLDINAESYKAYLAERFSSHNFTSEELSKIAGNISPDIFCSLDVAIENVILELNALPGTETKFSCSGHTDLAKLNSNDSHAYSAYLVFDTDEKDLIQELEFFTKEDKEVSMENAFLGGYRIGFQKKVPIDWIKNNQKKTLEELFEESKIEISKILGQEILNIPPPESQSDWQDFFSKVRQLQSNYIQSNPESATINYGCNSNLLKNIGEFSLSQLEWREYKDYYLSPESENSRLNFLKELAELTTRYRKNKKQH